MRRRTTILGVSVLLLAVANVSSAFGEDSDLARLFKNKALSGTIVISSLDGNTNYSYNDERGNTRLLPASTFKIPNTLKKPDARWGDLCRRLSPRRNGAGY